MTCACCWSPNWFLCALLSTLNDFRFAKQLFQLCLDGACFADDRDDDADGVLAPRRSALDGCTLLLLLLALMSALGPNFSGTPLACCSAGIISQSAWHASSSCTARLTWVNGVTAARTRNRSTRKKLLKLTVFISASSDVIKIWLKCFICACTSDWISR